MPRCGAAAAWAGLPWNSKTIPRAASEPSWPGSSRSFGWTIIAASTSSKSPASSMWILPPALSTADSSAGVPSSDRRAERLADHALQRERRPDGRGTDRVVPAGVAEAGQRVVLGDDRDLGPARAAELGAQPGRQPGPPGLAGDPVPGSNSWTLPTVRTSWKPSSGLAWMSSASAISSAASASTRSQASRFSWATRSGLSAVRSLLMSRSGSARAISSAKRAPSRELAHAAAEVLLGREPRVEEGLDQLERERRADDLGAEAHHVHVVVLDALVGRVDVVAERGPDARDLVGRDAGPDPGPADHDRPLGLAAADRVADPLGQVGEVDRLGRVGAEVGHLVAPGPQLLDDRPLEREPGVVASNRDLHGPR